MWAPRAARPARRSLWMQVLQRASLSAAGAAACCASCCASSSTHPAQAPNHLLPPFLRACRPCLRGILLQPTAGVQLGARPAGRGAAGPGRVHRPAGGAHVWRLVDPGACKRGGWLAMRACGSAGCCCWMGWQRSAGWPLAASHAAPPPLLPLPQNTHQCRSGYATQSTKILRWTTSRCAAVAAPPGVVEKA